MSKLTTVIPQGATLSGKIKAISSKSDLHRLIICACLSDKRCKIKYQAQLSKDIDATISCLHALGAEISVSDGVIEIIKPVSPENIPQDAVLDCGESGSTARFMLPVCALLAKGTTLVGHGKLPERPLGDLCKALNEMGAVFSSDKLPITVEKCMTPGENFKISGNVSSQYITGLLFVLPLCNAGGIVLTTALESGGYVNLTADAMKRFGVEVVCENNTYIANGKYKTEEEVILAQGDWSNSAFWLCAPKGDGKITVDGLDFSSSQPDKRVCDILCEMGMTVEKQESAVTVSAENGSHGITFDARNIPDLVPILAVRAAISRGDTQIKGIERLRLKESNRVKSVCDMINNLGGKAVSDASSIYIKGNSGKLSGGTVDSYNDHRIAMAAAIAASFCEKDVTIIGSDAVSKSYPQFYEHRKSLEI